MNNRIYREEHGSKNYIFHYKGARTAANAKADAGNLQWHENVEFLRVYSGTGTASLGTGEVEMESGNIIAISSDNLHSIVSHDKVVYDCLIISRDFALSAGIDTSLFDFTPRIRDASLTALFDRVRDAHNSDDELSPLRTSEAILAFLLGVLGKYATKREQPSSPDKRTETVKTAIRYIENHIDEKLSLDELSAVCAVSKFHFSRIFKDVTRTSPVEFVTAKRCEVAKRLLFNGAGSVTDVAAACGFDSPAYFSKVFRKNVGMRPSEYAKSKIFIV